MKNEHELKFDAFLDEWNKKVSLKDKLQLVDQTIQKKDPVLNFAIEVCRLGNDAASLQKQTGDRLDRATFLAAASVARLIVQGELLGYAFHGTATPGLLKAAAAKIVDWKTLDSALQAIDSSVFEREYYQWALRAVQKKQNPLPSMSLLNAIKFVREASGSSRPDRRD